MLLPCMVSIDITIDEAIQVHSILVSSPTIFNDKLQVFSPKKLKDAHFTILPFLKPRATIN